MKITEHVIALDQQNEGPPVFDIEIPTLAGQPAPCRMVYGRLEQPKVLGAKPRLVHCAIFAFDPDEPKQTRRLAILTGSGYIPEELAPDAKYLGSYIHPRTGGAISLYEIPCVPLEDDAVPTEKPVDVVAAIEAARDAQDGGGQ